MGTTCKHGTSFATLLNDGTALSGTERKVVAVSGGEALILGLTTTNVNRYGHDGKIISSTGIALPAQLAYRIGNDLVVVSLT